MATKELIDIIKRANELSPEEQMELIAHLAEQARRTLQTIPESRQWRELYGAAPYPLLGSDAQEWVSRTRREADSSRERPWKTSPPSCW